MSPGAVITIKVKSKAMAEFFMPALSGDKSWTQDTQDILEGLMHYSYSAGRCTYTDLWSLIIMPPLKIKELLNTIPKAENARKLFENLESLERRELLVTLAKRTRCFVNMRGSIVH